MSNPPFDFLPVQHATNSKRCNTKLSRNTLPDAPSCIATSLLNVAVASQQAFHPFVSEMIPRVGGMKMLCAAEFSEDTNQCDAFECVADATPPTTTWFVYDFALKNRFDLVFFCRKIVLMILFFKTILVRIGNGSGFFLK